MQIIGLRVRIHTLVLLRWSAATIVDGGELNFCYAGDELQKGISKFAPLTAPRDAIFLLDALLVKAHLLDHRTGAGVAPVAGSFSDSGGQYVGMVRATDRLRGIEMAEMNKDNTEVLLVIL
jgi:hypothetical protein